MSILETTIDKSVGVSFKLAESKQTGFRVRYAGLAKELGARGALACFSFDPEAYDPTTHRFADYQRIDSKIVPETVIPRVVRNLALKYEGRPIYEDPEAPRLVHDTQFNRTLARKDEVAKLLPDVHPITIAASAEDLLEAVAAIPGKIVVIKPVTGLLSKGVQVFDKKDYQKPEPGEYLAQEFIDTRRGDPHLGIKGLHNLRLISIDSILIGAIPRIDSQNDKLVYDAPFGKVYDPESLPDEALNIADQVHARFKELPGEGHNAIALDLMYGRGASGEDSYVLCEVNERPYRVSPAELNDADIYDPKGMSWLMGRWDAAEAQMLSELAERETNS